MKQILFKYFMLSYLCFCIKQLWLFIIIWAVNV